jgi:RNA polymerase-associated protein LEO1
VLLKQSNIFQVQTRPFDPVTHVLEGDVVGNAASGQQEVRAFDNNVVRWRWGPGGPGSGQAESNARLVRWSDGSLQVQLGRETLDVATVDMSSDNTHLCRRVPPPASILAFQGQVNSRLTLRPSSLDSKSHKLLAAATALKHAKVQRVKKTLVTVDPEREKRDAELAEAQRAKDRDKLAKKQAQVARRYDLDGPLGRGSAYGGPLTAGFLEGDDDGAQPMALAGRPHGGGGTKKRKAPRGGAGEFEDSDDDEGSWSEEAPARVGGRKRAFNSDDD